MESRQIVKQVEEVLRWKLVLRPNYMEMQAVKYDHEPTKRLPAASVLPFPSDSVETDGARGVETPRGVDTWLELWASTFAWLLDVSGPRMTGAWLLSVLRDHPDLNPLPTVDDDNPDGPHSQWVRELWSAWEQFSEELATLHAYLADQTGHKPRYRSLCPICKHGRLASVAGSKGFEDLATCTNPDCSTQVDYAQEEVAASFRSVLRDVNIPQSYYLDLQGVRVVWPNLKVATLRKWVERGKVDKQGKRYKLADINMAKSVPGGHDLTP